MEVFAQIEEKIDAALAKKTDSMDFYSQIMAKMVHLTPSQRKALFEKAEELNEQDNVGKGNLALIKGMRFVFEADFQKATQRVYHSRVNASKLTVNVVK